MTWHALSGLWTLVLPRSYARNRSEIKLLLRHLLKPLQHLCQDLIPHRALMLDLEPVVGREKGRANVAVIAYFDCLFACLFVFLSRKTWRASRVTWTVGPRWSALDSLLWSPTLPKRSSRNARTCPIAYVSTLQWFTFPSDLLPNLHRDTKLTFNIGSGFAEM